MNLLHMSEHRLTHYPLITVTYMLQLDSPNHQQNFSKHMSLKSLKNNMLFSMIHFTPVAHNIDYTALCHHKTTLIGIIFKEHNQTSSKRVTQTIEA